MDRELIVRNNISKKVREAREAKGLSMRGMADRALINYCTIMRLESPAYPTSPTLGTIVTIADFLDIPLSELFDDGV